MNRELLLIRIFVIDPEDNREELEVESWIVRTLRRSIEERRARERFERWLDEDQSKEN